MLKIAISQTSRCVQISNMNKRIYWVSWTTFVCDFVKNFSIDRNQCFSFTLPGTLTSSSSCTISNTCTSPKDRSSRFSVWLPSFSSPPLAGVGSVGSPARWLDRIRYRSSRLVLHLTLRRSPMILWLLPCDGRKAWWARRGRARASRTCGCTGASYKMNWYIEFGYNSQR